MLSWMLSHHPFLEDLMALVGMGWQRFKNAQESVLTAKVMI